MSETTFDYIPTTSASARIFRDDSIDTRTVNKYLLMTHLYEGTGGIETGQYLVPYPREILYEDRKRISAYRNYLKPIVDSFVAPVFAAPITRETSSNLFASFLTNCDVKGSSLTQMTRHICTLTRLHGVSFVVMDNFNILPHREAEAIETRQYPYIYVEPAYAVTEVTTDAFGRISAITFARPAEVIAGKSFEVTHTWNSESLRITYWQNGKPVPEMTAVRPHGLSVMPVIAVYNGTIDTALPTPPMLDIAKLNLQLYNQDSQISDQERAQAFSLLYVHSADKSLVVSPHSMIVLAENASDPGYISPDSSIMTHLLASAQKTRDAIFEAAGQNGTIAIKEVSSGIAESYRFKAVGAQLEETARLAESVELRIAQLFSLYITSEVSLTVSYQKKYDVLLSRMSMDDFSKVLAMELPEEIKNEVKKNITQLLLDNLDQERIEQLKSLLDEKGPMLPNVEA